MLDRLKLNNFNNGKEPFITNEKDFFVMKTCQRTLVLSYGYNPFQEESSGHDFFQGKEAYTYLLEIICGLKSKMVGENEIVGQFKQAYHSYLEKEQRCNKLLQIIEKLFQDAKEVRTKYLLGLSQKTYSSIARKHIVSKHKAQEVLILGSGLLAEDLINQFKKKAKVYICARNEQRVKQLAIEHDLEIICWSDKNLIANFPFIANSIGFKGVLLDEQFFCSWVQRHDKRLFIDLGSPSAIVTHLSYAQGIMRLDDVFGEGAIHETHKKNQIQIARTAMEGIAAKRDEIFRKKIEMQKQIESTDINPSTNVNLAYV
jgi:glutamyl-tRNA reductase